MKMITGLLCFSVTLLNGCGVHLLDNRLEEGVIEYALSFPDYDPDGIMGGMLPERSTLSFTTNKQLVELNAGMGIFRTAMISDNAAHAMDYHMSMMSKKIVAKMVPRDLEMFNSDRAKPTIIYTQDVDTVAGFPCQRAIAIFSELDHPEIELWFTDRIEIKDPNWFGPFSEIPGVLLRYDIIQHGIHMRLDAISVTPGKVDPTKFHKRAEYEIVPPVVLHQELAEVLGTFSM